MQPRKQPRRESNEPRVTAVRCQAVSLRVREVPVYGSAVGGTFVHKAGWAHSLEVEQDTTASKEARAQPLPAGLLLVAVPEIAVLMDQVSCPRSGTPQTED